jgi:hypothetical protein
LYDISYCIVYAESLADIGETLEAEIDGLKDLLSRAETAIEAKTEENAGMANQIRMLKDQVKREQDTAEAARVDKAKNELLISGYEREINTLRTSSRKSRSGQEKPIPELCQWIFGQMFAGKGYLSKEPPQTLGQGIQLITPFRKNSKFNLRFPSIDIYL